jgi:hypothetical protein
MAELLKAHAIIPVADAVISATVAGLSVRDVDALANIRQGYLEQPNQQKNYSDH